MKNKCPDDEKIEKTKEIIIFFDIKKGKKLTQLYLKSDVLLLAFVFQKFINVSMNEFGINPLYYVTLPGYTWQCGLKYTGINLKTLHDKDLILTLENHIRGWISSVMSDRYVKSDENNKILYMDATILTGHSMIQPLHYDEFEMWHGHPDIYKKKLNEISNTPDESDNGHFPEVDLKYPDSINEKPRNYKNAKKLICDWTDQENYLIIIGW